jgi:hypothetical protein
VPAGLSDERCRSKHWGGSGNTLSFLSKHEQIYHSAIQSLCAGILRVSSAALPLSSCSEGLAALQATGLVARRNESAKWAHPLGREVAVVWFHSQKLPERSCEEGTQAANTSKKWMRDRSHS